MKQLEVEAIRSKIYEAVNMKSNAYGEWFHWNGEDRYFVEVDEILNLIKEIEL
jgi:hypothetical protein